MLDWWLNNALVEFNTEEKLAPLFSNPEWNVIIDVFISLCLEVILIVNCSTGIYLMVTEADQK